jgi:hypothetical protein
VSKRGPKLASRIRSGGVVLSRGHLLDLAASDPASAPILAKKARVIGLPHRKASSLKKR